MSIDILFPGPGLAIRMPGFITKDKIRILKQADNIFINELKKETCITKYGKLTALLPVKTVGVMVIIELTSTFVY